MNISSLKIRWYAANILKLSIVCVRVLCYCLRHPAKLFDLSFSFYSLLNNFYQNSHGHLLNFEESSLSKKLRRETIFARTNYFATDLSVMQPMEIQILSSLVAYLKPQHVLEIGTYLGYTTLHFTINTPDDSLIYTLDLPPDFHQLRKHSREFVRSDTENALKMLSTRGVIVWHDYDYIIHPDIFHYLNNLSRHYTIYSVAHTRLAIYGPAI